MYGYGSPVISSGVAGAIGIAGAMASSECQGQAALGD